MARTKLNGLLAGLSGRIGKDLVVKQYKDKVVISMMPEMRKKKPTELQTLRQKLFSDANAYAQAVILDEKKAAAYKKQLKPGKYVYHAAVSAYLKSWGKPAI
jgi:hypothetical protein